MAYVAKETLTIPLRDKLTDLTGETSVSWTSFFRAVYERLIPLGSEKSFDFVGGVSSNPEDPTGPQDLVGMRFNSANETFIITEYIVQRISTGVGAVEKIECGTLIAIFKPYSSIWTITNPTPWGDDAGMTFSILSNGQVQLDCDAITGARKIEKITWRSRTISAKIARQLMGLT